MKLDYSFISVLTAPYMEHGTQWEERGQSSARMLLANLWLQPQLILPLLVFSFFFPSFLPCISTTREKSTSMRPCWVLTCCRSVFGNCAIRGSFPAYRALTIKQDICTDWVGCQSTDTLSQTCITREALKASLWSSAKKKKKKRKNENNAETTQE